MRSKLPDRQGILPGWAVATDARPTSHSRWMQMQCAATCSVSAQKRECMREHHHHHQIWSGSSGRDKKTALPLKMGRLWGLAVKFLYSHLESLIFDDLFRLLVLVAVNRCVLCFDVQPKETKRPHLHGVIGSSKKSGRLRSGIVDSRAWVLALGIDKAGEKDQEGRFRTYTYTTMKFSRTSSIWCAVLAMLGMVDAHIVMTYPGWRGDNLVTNATFPYGMQWMYPCE